MFLYLKPRPGVPEFQITVDVVVTVVVGDAFSSRFEFVQAEISHFENPPTVDQTVGGFQITVRLDRWVV